MARSTDVVLSFDLGGTKLRGAHVDARGRILDVAFTRVRQAEGYPGLIRLFKETAELLPKRKIARIAVASAGPLHPDKGVLLDPTNFFTDKKSWGVVPLVKDLKNAFKKPVQLENDAAAAVLGEFWKGGHGRAKNIVAITLGTGVGVGVICNGELVRAGRGLHPEAGHIPLDIFAKDYPCGCGAHGCIEAFLAGSHFTKRLSALKHRMLTGQEAVLLAQDGDAQITAAFKEYGRQLADAIRIFVVMFAPEVVVLSGGFSHASHLFFPETRRLLPQLLQRYRKGIDLLPELKASKLQDDAGILGAAYRAHHS